ncbi:MAG: helix-hairpin-helix domain-containing protein [Acetivibrio ethanolgignens]
MNYKRTGILAIILLFCGMGIFYSCISFRQKKQENIVEEKEALGNPKELEEEEKPEKAAEQQRICVHVCGEVKKPGMYYMAPESRVNDAIEAAGGFTEIAREDSVNLARSLQDGEQLYVHSADEEVSDGRININMASKEQLMQLPGIGEAKAEAIVAYRNHHGSFMAVEDLLKIEGIKDGVLEKIKDKITI